MKRVESSQVDASCPGIPYFGPFSKSLKAAAYHPKMKKGWKYITQRLHIRWRSRSKTGPSLSLPAGLSHALVARCDFELQPHRGHFAPGSEFPCRTCSQALSGRPFSSEYSWERGKEKVSDSSFLPSSFPSFLFLVDKSAVGRAVFPSGLIHALACLVKKAS